MNPSIRGGLERKAVDREVIVHDVAGNKVHILNDSAAEILELCDGSRSLGDIVRTFGAGKQASEQTIRADVETILAEFERLGLLAR